MSFNLSPNINEFLSSPNTEFLYPSFLTLMSFYPLFPNASKFLCSLSWY